jgi:hypothetical protein
MENFNITLFAGLEGYLDLDPFIEAAYMLMGKKRQDEIEDMARERESKLKAQREAMETNSRESFDKLSQFKI